MRRAAHRDDRALFSSTLVEVGRLRCTPDHPGFSEPGPTRTYCFAFPRAATWIEQEGGAPFVSDPNTVTLYNAGTVRRRRAIDPAGIRADWFALAPDVLRDMLRDFDRPAADLERPLRFGRLAATPRLYLLQRAIYRYVRASDAPDALLVEEAVIGLIAEILEAAPARVASAAPLAHRRLAERTREYLALTYARGDGVDVIAREVGCSVYHLCRLFRQQTGLSIHQYRTQLRLRRSLELMEGRPGDILGAAVRMGFSGHSHYTRIFQRTFRLAPSRFSRSDALAADIEFASQLGGHGLRDPRPKM